MTICFDLDGTICSAVENSRYEDAMPDHTVVNEINRLYDNGNRIIIFTARGSVSGVDHTELTKSQLAEWNIKHHELIMNKKPHADLFVDDRAVGIDEWKKSIPTVNGIVAGAFDIIHSGYIKMFKEAKLNCTRLHVALHRDPSVNGKLRPVNSVASRKDVLSSIRYVDNIIEYDTEDDLYLLLASGWFDVRFLGDDYFGKGYTGMDLPIKTIWIDRSHNISTTSIKNDIYESIRNINESK